MAQYWSDFWREWWWSGRDCSILSPPLPVQHLSLAFVPPFPFFPFSLDSSVPPGLNQSRRHQVSLANTTTPTASLARCSPVTSVQQEPMCPSTAAPNTSLRVCSSQPHGDLHSDTRMASRNATSVVSRAPGRWSRNYLVLPWLTENALAHLACSSRMVPAFPTR